MSNPPACGFPSILPAVYPAIYTLLFESIATPWASSLLDEPNCFVHTNVPAESYFAKNASTDPEFGPSKLPYVYPVIYTLLSESIATLLPRSSVYVPNCFVQTNVPVESYFAINASSPPALVFPSKSPFVYPVIYTLLFESIATPRA